MTSPHPAVVSLVPSVTETLLAWGITPVACTRFCEQPHLAHVGGTKDPDLTAIAALRPDLVVMDAEENRREDFDALRAAGIPIHALHVRSVDDALDQLTSLASELGVEPPPSWSWPPVVDGPRRSAYVPIWRRPWMALGGPTYGQDLLARLGVDVVTDPAGGAYPQLDLDEARRRRPDLVIAPSEPYPFAERHRAELETVAPVVFVDGQDLFWWGARTPGARERLGAVLSAP